MFGLGVPELIVIFVLALIVFGPKKLPELGKSVGRAMQEFKKAQQEFQAQVQAEMRDVETKAELDKLKEIGKIDFDAPQTTPGVSAENTPKPSPDTHAPAGEQQASGPYPSESGPAKNVEAKGNG